VSLILQIACSILLHYHASVFLYTPSQKRNTVTFCICTRNDTFSLIQKCSSAVAATCDALSITSLVARKLLGASFSLVRKCVGKPLLQKWQWDTIEVWLTWCSSQWDWRSEVTFIFWKTRVKCKYNLYGCFHKRFIDEVWSFFSVLLKFVTCRVSSKFGKRLSKKNQSPTFSKLLRLIIYSARVNDGTGQALQTLQLEHYS